jgi:hypothetical protein
MNCYLTSILNHWAVYVLFRWNVRRLYRPGSLVTVARELARCGLDLVGVQEVM